MEAEAGDEEGGGHDSGNNVGVGNSNDMGNSLFDILGDGQRENR